LPDGRVFLIGGSSDLNHTKTFKNTYEVVEGALQ